MSIFREAKGFFTFRRFNYTIVSTFGPVLTGEGHSATVKRDVEAIVHQLSINGSVGDSFTLKVERIK